MSSPNLPPCPPQLKTVQHYLKIANDYDKREPVVAYWVRLYALQTALKLDRKSPEARALLTALMDYLETFKKTALKLDRKSPEARALLTALMDYLETFKKTALKLDRKSPEARALLTALMDYLETFKKESYSYKRSRKLPNVVKVFYSAGLLCDVCEVFGELTDEVASQRKYAKWKATYIHNCLKNGEKPIPGPMGGDDEGLGEDVGGDEAQGAVGHSGGADLGWSHPPQPGMSLPSVPNSASAGGMPDVSSSTPPPSVPSVPHSLPQMPRVQPTPDAGNIPHMPVTQTSSTGVKLSPSDMNKAQKYCKWAVSALDYEDSKTAIDNLQKALNLLRTGKDS
ncbi:vacuolar protein sorting-associated protein VTA1 homolog [Penaeus indicus]|uniref:vacuolar protein sorting-associated protein VTA1 homolog n=1 Tax=Penaeus indicus TaxID=29960 RepID=UPI00300DAA19